jgi:predicted nucleotidyltransferase
MRELRTTFRRAFFVEFSRDYTPLTKFEVTEEMRKKASAWYYVAYQSEQTTKNSEEQPKRFIGFPWIVDDVLVTIPPVSKPSPKQDVQEKNAYSAIENSLGEHFAKQAEKLIEDYQHRLQVKSLIQNAIKETSRVNGVVMFGSSATFFFEDTSDIDLCALPSNESSCVLSENALKLARNISQPDQKSLLRKLEHRLRRVYNGVHFISARVPIFRLAGLKGTEFGSKLCADLCANPDGFLKAMVVSWYIHKYPPLLPLLRMLIQWARDSGLISKREGCFINTNVLVFMLLSFCVRAGWVDEPAVDEIRRDVENIARNRVCLFLFTL